MRTVIWPTSVSRASMRFVVLHHLGGELGVAPDQRFDRAGQLRLSEAAHLGDHVVEALQILIEALDDMVGRLVEHVGVPLSRSGR
jgi:hypothetical protein